MSLTAVSLALLVLKQQCGLANKFDPTNCSAFNLGASEQKWQYSS